MSNTAYSTLTAQNQSAVLRLIQQELKADDISGCDFYSKVLLDPNFRQDLAVTACIDGETAGFMYGVIRRGAIEDAESDTDKGWITLMAVDSRFHRRGIGSEMLSRLLEVFASNNIKSVWVSPYAPNYFAPGVDKKAYPAALQFLKKHGFTAVYEPLSMELPLDGFVLPEQAKENDKNLASNGTVIEEFDSRHIIPLMELLRDCFPGDWQRILRSSIQACMQNKNPDIHILTAMKDGVCLGFCQHNRERFGPFGVRSSERGNGIGASILFRCLERMKQSGLEKAWFMWTDDRAARLYSRAGFRETRRFTVMRRNLE